MRPACQGQPGRAYQRGLARIWTTEATTIAAASTGTSGLPSTGRNSLAATKASVIATTATMAAAAAWPRDPRMYLVTIRSSS